MANIRIERSNFGGSRSFVAEMSRAGRALIIGPRHRGKTSELPALSAEQTSCGCGDCRAVQTAAQLCSDAPTGPQPHAHGVIKPFSETLEILFRRTETQLRQMVGLPITPESFLFAMDAERMAGRKALYPAKDAALA